MSGFLAVIDPPWSADAGGGGRGANMHYALDGVDAIARGYLGARTTEPNAGPCIWPHPSRSTDPVLCFMWATAGAMSQPENGNPPDAYVLARLLGVRVAAIFTWCKVDEVATWSAAKKSFEETAYVPPARMGLGQWSRVEHEYLLLCRRGSVPVPAPDVRPRSVIYAPRGEHSAKPERAWTQVIEPIALSCMPDVVGVEFNARKRREGWAAYGALDGEDKPLRYSQDQPQTDAGATT